jgi:hypothetical protein
MGQLRPRGRKKSWKITVYQKKAWKLPFAPPWMLFKSAKLRIPFQFYIDEMGKDISGTGFDTKVVGRIGMPLVAKEPETPKVKRIVVCNLTNNTAGNADGIGLADFVTRRLVDKIDLEIIMEEQMIEFNQEDNLKPLLKKASGG